MPFTETERISTLKMKEFCYRYLRTMKKKHIILFCVHIYKPWNNLQERSEVSGGFFLFLCLKNEITFPGYE